LRVKQVAAGVLVFLVVLGIGAAWQQHRVPTDAYGYTAAERQALVSGFVSGLGSGTTAACLADAFERNFSHTELMAEDPGYSQTGRFSPEFIAKLDQVVNTSGC
jgi:cysteine synthase